MRIFELFDRTSSINWQRRSSEGWLGGFEVDGRTYDVAIMSKHDPQASRWFVTFAAHDDYGRRVYHDTGMSGSGAKIVLATVQSALVEFIHEERPDEVEFDAVKRELATKLDNADVKDHRKPGSGQGRASVYAMMLGRLAPSLRKLGYAAKHFSGDSDEYFIIRRAEPTPSGT